jgi:predicted nucleic acid-binding protein
LNSEFRPFERHDPGRYRATLAYRPRDELPWSLDAIATDAVLMLDTTVYIDALKAKLPQDLAARIATAEIVHSAVALGEIAANLGLLDPAHAGTPAVGKVLRETLARADPKRTTAPSAEAWLEASVLAGILARTQGFPRADRRKLLNDALILLSAHEAGAVLVSRNVRDMDLLMQLRPGVQVLLYDQGQA